MKKRTPYKRINDHLDGIRTVMLKCDARQLRALAKKLDGLNETNCSWVTYWARDVLQGYLNEIQEWNRHHRGKNRTKVEGESNG